MAELQGHMEHDTKADKALCGEPDAYIIYVGFSLEPNAEDGVSCDRCLEKNNRLRGQGVWRAGSLS